MSRVNAGRFWHLKSGFVILMIPKCGSATIFRSLIEANRLNYNRHKLMKICIPQRQHENKPALVAIRDPVERFKSAVSHVNRNSTHISVDGILDGLESGSYKDQHFMSQSAELSACDGCESVKLYRFPFDFEQMLFDGGLNAKIPHKNQSISKPILTDDQERRVVEYYKDDIKLFNSIQKAGQEFLLEST